MSSERAYLSGYCHWDCDQASSVELTPLVLFVEHSEVAEKQEERVEYWNQYDENGGVCVAHAFGAHHQNAEDIAEKAEEEYEH